MVSAAQTYNRHFFSRLLAFLLLAVFCVNYGTAIAHKHNNVVICSAVAENENDLMTDDVCAVCDYIVHATASEIVTVVTVDIVKRVLHTSPLLCQLSEPLFDTTLSGLVNKGPPAFIA